MATRRYFYQSDGLTGNNTENVKLPNGNFFDACSDDPTKRCPWTRGDYWEISAQLGGPIVKDKLWFFGSYGHQLDNYTLRGVNPQAPFSAINIKKDRYFLKLNWQISPSHRLVGTFNRDRSPQDRGCDFQRGALHRLDADPDGSHAGPCLHGDALEQDDAGRPVFRLLRQRDRPARPIRTLPFPRRASSTSTAASSPVAPPSGTTTTPSARR